MKPARVARQRFRIGLVSGEFLPPIYIRRETVKTALLDGEFCGFIGALTGWKLFSFNEIRSNGPCGMTSWARRGGPLSLEPRERQGTPKGAPRNAGGTGRGYKSALLRAAYS